MDKVNFFDYIDDESFSGISRVVRNNDEVKLRKILIEKKRKRKSLSLPMDNRGWTAMHVAASRKDGTECLELLLRYSKYVEIDPNARSFDGKTALFIACEEGCEQNVLSMLKAGSDANAKTLDGTSSLHVASVKGFATVARYLLRSGAAVDAQDWQGFTSLHLASLYDQFRICEVLLENGASSRIPDSDGNLALHLACQRSNFAIVRLLLEKKKDNDDDDDDDDVNRQNYDGITPLMLAVRNRGNEECVNYLLGRGASIKTQSKDGFIALQYAASGGNATILRTLLDRIRDIDVGEICFRRVEYILKNQGIFYPPVCCALNSGSVDCLNALLGCASLKRFILEAPYVENGDHCTDVFSPLAYLFSVRDELADETFDKLLRLLLAHEIVYANNFVDQLKVEWPPARVNFINPLAIIFNSLWPDRDKLAYSTILNEYHVTADYCLQCFDDNTSNFTDFGLLHGYQTFYKPVLDAVNNARVDIVGLFLSYSRILEPDQLCYHLVTTVPQSQSLESPEEFEKFRFLYYYLVGLKPSYYNCDRYPGVTSLTHSLFSREEEFSRSNLQQLCRNTLRQQLRGDTLHDNIRNFHARIIALPLPNRLKDYLLFKN